MGGTAKTEAYMDARKKFTQANSMLTGSPADDKEQFNRAWNAGQQSIRTYHDEEHFHDIAGRGEIKDAMDAVRFRSGINHDVVYHQVDAKGENKSGFAPEVEQTIGKYISREGNNLVISKDAALADDKLFQAAMTLFNFDESKRADGITLSPFAGQNEFLSALYAIEQAKEIGIPDKYIVAEVAHIQGTVPFGPADHFEKLEQRLEKVNGTLPEGQRLSGDELSQSIESSVRMANADVKSFSQEKFGDFIKDSRELMIENVAVSPDNLDKPAFMLAATMGPVGFLDGMLANNSPSGKNRIYHAVHNKPEADAMAKDEAAGIDNIKKMAEYFRANAAAVGVVTALTVANTPQGSTPSTDFSLTKTLNREFELPARGNGELSGYGKDALAEAKGDDGKGMLMTDQVAAYLLESLGSDGVKKLAQLTNDTGVNPAPAMPPFSPNPKPGMNTQELAGAYLEKAQAIFAEKGVDFNQVRQDLENGMQAKELPFKTKEDFAERAKQSKNALDKFLNSDDWKKGGWAKGGTA